MQPAKMFNASLLIILAVAGAAAVFLNARWFMSDAYTRYSEGQWQWADARASARQAAGFAYRLTPDNARALKSAAIADLYSNQPDQALLEYRQALQLAPADAYLWRDYAFALVSTGHFDDRVQQAVRHAQALAAQSDTLQLSLALIGTGVYRQSDPALRALWLASIRHSFAAHWQPLLEAASRAGQEELLCREVIAKPDSNPWCIQVRAKEKACRSHAAAGCDSQAGAGVSQK
ncbi:MAG: hypothetical protein ACRESS_08330 [Stenotrophobium sp.]